MFLTGEVQWLHAPHLTAHHRPLPRRPLRRDRHHGPGAPWAHVLVRSAGLRSRARALRARHEGRGARREVIRRNLTGTSSRRTNGEGFNPFSGDERPSRTVVGYRAPWAAEGEPSPLQDVPPPKVYPATTRARCWGDHCDVTVPMSHVRRGLTESCGAEGCGPDHPYARGSQA